MLADRTKRIGVSPTMKVAAEAMRLKAQGVDVIDFGAAEPILAAITPRTRGIIINSPGNPTGALMSEEDTAAIADGAAKRGIWVLLDLCYDKLIYDRTPHNLPAILFERLRDRTVLCG